MNKKAIQGYIMAGVGFTLLLITALSYLLDWDFGNPSLSTIGLIFIFVGLKIAH